VKESYQKLVENRKSPFSKLNTSIEQFIEQNEPLFVHFGDIEF